MRIDTISLPILLGSASVGMHGVYFGVMQIFKFVVIDVRISGLLLAVEIISLDPRIILIIIPQL
jgi:hypothetical protein